MPNLTFFIFFCAIFKLKLYLSSGILNLLCSSSNMAASLCWIGSESSSSDPWTVLKIEKAWRGSSSNRLLNLFVIQPRILVTSSFGTTSTFLFPMESSLRINLLLWTGWISSNSDMTLAENFFWKEEWLCLVKQFYLLEELSLLFYYCYTKPIM